LKRYLVILLLAISSTNLAIAKTVVDSLYNIAQTHFKNGDYATGYKYSVAMLTAAEQTGNCNDICRAMLRVAASHYYLQQRDLGLQWMHKAYNQAYKCNIDSFKWIAARQIGAIYFEKSKDDSCMIFLKEAERLLNRTDGNWAERSYLYSIMGEVLYRHMNRRAEGKKCFDLAIEYGYRSNDSVKMAFANVKQGSYYNTEENCKQAIVYYQRAVDLYTAIHQTEGIMYSTHMLAWAYSKCGDAAKTYDLMLELKTRRDSIFKDETAVKTAEYRTLYETERKEKENIQLQKNNQLILISAISALLILIAVFLLIYNRYRHKKKIEMDERITLQQKLRFKAVMEAEEKERVRIARELHDSLGQMLSAAKMNVSAIDSQNEEDAKLMNNAKKLIDDSVKEVRTISHNLMPAGLMDKGIEFALHELANKINDTGLLQIELMITEGEQRLDSSVEIAIYRIVQEVVNNMIKHSKANKVEVLLDYNTEKIYLSIKDNGVGFDTAAIETSSGIGWKNIFSRVYMMNGDVEVNSQPGKGTLVNIEFAK
jgi:signal transduction histidine kinase